jgi:hypothetical protein
VTLAVVLLLAVAHPAGAAQPASASGTFAFLSSSVTPIRADGGNLVLQQVASIAYSGDLAGVVTATATITVHSDGSINGRGTETCSSCTIGGRTGSFAAVYSFTGSGGGFAGHETFTDAAGGLTGLHAQGTFQGDFVSNSYSYEYHFEP